MFDFYAWDRGFKSSGNSIQHEKCFVNTHVRFLVHIICTHARARRILVLDLFLVYPEWTLMKNMSPYYCTEDLRIVMHSNA